MPLDNRPTVDKMLAHLRGTDLSQWRDEDGSYPTLQRLLDASIAWVEQEASTSFNPERITEVRDGNGTNQLTLFKRPANKVFDLRVHTPILGYTRVYTPEEVQLYPNQGIVKVFTYKLAVEQALLMTLDYQAWGTLFPPLPRAVEIDYAYGYPLYDADNDETSFDGVNFEPGDLRDPLQKRGLETLQEAAVLDACASFLAQTHGAATGPIASVSFDGLSTSFLQTGLDAEAKSFADERDRLMGRKRRRFMMATGGRS